jgi:hypothetical protein
VGIAGESVFRELRKASNTVIVVPSLIRLMVGGAVKDDPNRVFGQECESPVFLIVVRHAPFLPRACWLWTKNNGNSKKVRVPIS